MQKKQRYEDQEVRVIKQKQSTHPTELVGIAW